MVKWMSNDSFLNSKKDIFLKIRIKQYKISIVPGVLACWRSGVLAKDYF